MTCKVDLASTASAPFVPGIASNVEESGDGKRFGGIYTHHSPPATRVGEICTAGHEWWRLLRRSSLFSSCCWGRMGIAEIMLEERTPGGFNCSGDKEFGS